MRFLTRDIEIKSTFPAKVSSTIQAPCKELPRISSTVSSSDRFWQIGKKRALKVFWRKSKPTCSLGKRWI